MLSTRLLSLSLLALLVGCDGSARAWEEARQTGTPSAIREFLAKHPTAEIAAEARHALQVLDSRAWEEADANGASESYRSYIAAHPEGAHVSEAKHAIEKLALGAARKVGTIDALEAFLVQFPDGVRRVEIAREVEVARGWEAASAADTPAAYREFLAAFPAESMAARAREALHVHDTRSWDQALANKSEEALLAYATQFPDGAHTDEARTMAETLALESARADGTVEALQKFVASYPDGQQVGSIAEEVATRLENRDWRRATDAGSTEALESFVAEYPKGQFAAEATRLLALSPFERELGLASLAGTVDAYKAVLKAYPDQDQLIVFEGGIGGFMTMRIDLSELCPEDRPELERIAKRQGVAWDDVEFFPGFSVGAPPTKKVDDVFKSSRDREVRDDCYPIPQWRAEQLELFKVNVTSDGPGQVSRSMNFGENANKVFVFVGRKSGAKYRIVAASLDRTLE